MKKILAMVLAMMLVLSMSAAFAEVANQDASFSKTYKVINEGTESPAETFTFEYEAYRITDSNVNLTVEDMPEIADSTVTFAKGAATVTGFTQAVNVALANIEWPGVGVYYYYVTEVVPVAETAGVEYNTDETEHAYLKVTVPYDEGTDTYYTAFVTLNLADANNDSKTDSKIAGFKNEYSAGSLAIEKAVTGNLGDQNKYFEVTVAFTAPTNEVVKSDIFYKGGSGDYAVNSTAVAAGEEGWTGTKTVTINLKHTDKITFTNIPYGVTYTVTESDYTDEANGGYDEADYYVNNVKEATGEEDDTFAADDIASPRDEVKIVNAKSTSVDTGISLDNAPYMILMALVVVAGAALIVKRASANR